MGHQGKWHISPCGFLLYAKASQTLVTVIITNNYIRKNSVGFHEKYIGYTVYTGFKCWLSVQQLMFSFLSPCQETPVSWFVQEQWSKAAVDMSRWQCHRNANMVAQPYIGSIKIVWNWNCHRNALCVVSRECVMAQLPGLQHRWQSCHWMQLKAEG